jgi:hypothetical protein
VQVKTKPRQGNQARQRKGVRPMPETIEIQAFSYSELSPRAQEKVRGWWLSVHEPDNYYLIKKIKNAANLLGIEIDSQGNRDSIFWQASHCQGDGASFDGNYRYRKGSVEAIKKEYPDDKYLICIAKSLQFAQRRAFYSLNAKIKSNRHNEVCVEVSDDKDHNKEIDNELEIIINFSMQDFATWIHRLVLHQYDFEFSKDNMICCFYINEYRFDKNGRII